MANFEKIDLGWVFETTELLVFFGNKKAHLQSLNSRYPQYTFLKIKQTHSDICRRAKLEPSEADAHWSDLGQEALLISTADCLPIMIYCSQTKRCAAVHAGWRGVANKILIKTLEQLVATGSTNRQFKFWIGPHILHASFEVKEDCLELLKKEPFGLSETQYVDDSNNQIKVNLLALVRAQIMFYLKKEDEKIKIQDVESNIEVLAVDTFQDMNLNSFRREREVAQRNLSFIVLK